MLGLTKRFGGVSVAAILGVETSPPLWSVCDALAGDL
jgi:hypothetical protein